MGKAQRKQKTRKEKFAESTTNVVAEVSGAAAWQGSAVLWDDYIRPQLDASGCPSWLSYFILRSLWVGIFDVSANLAVDFICTLITQKAFGSYEGFKKFFTAYFSNSENYIRKPFLQLANGVLWQPIVSGGEALGRLLTEETIGIASAAGSAISVGNLAITAGIKKVLELNNPSVAMNMLSALFFYLEQPLPLPGSPSGERDLGWVLALVSAASIAGEGATQFVSWLYGKWKNSSRTEEGQHLVDNQIDSEKKPSFWRRVLPACCFRGSEENYPSP